MRILVTSFEPFGNDSENASSAAMRELLARWQEPDLELVGVELPVTFDEAPFRRAVAEHSPDLIVALGEAGARRSLTPEFRAVNDMTARIPDNTGARPQAQPVELGAEPERRASLDVEAIVDAILEAGWAAAPSDDAGRFVCNFIAYHAYGLDVPAVFIHVPAVRSAGESTVGAETDPEPDGTPPGAGRQPETAADLADALAAAIRCLRPSSPRSAPATTA